MADNVNEKYRKIKIPKQEFKQNKKDKKVNIDESIANEIREVFKLFSKTDEVNPHNIKDALRSISKYPFKLDFHKENPHIYKILEEMCLEYDIDSIPIDCDYFLDFINERLGDNHSRHGINNIFAKLSNHETEDITPESLHNAINSLGENLSLEDIKYIMEKIADSSNNSNISSDEFYYIMTKKPSDFDKLMKVTKNI